MRRPLSIMRADATAGWIELLYKVVGPGLHGARGAAQGARNVSVLGPIGRPFSAHPERPRTLLLGGGVGIPPMVFLAERLAASKQAHWKPLVLMGSEVPFPFRERPSTIIVPGMPAGSIACMPLLEEWGVPSRLASGADFPGCFPGFVTELADVWLASLSRRSSPRWRYSPAARRRCSRRAPRWPALPACPARCRWRSSWRARSAAAPAAPSLVRTAAGAAMKRVCVDGPVFDAYTVF